MQHDSTDSLRSGAFAVKVLGCKVNAYEAQQIRRRLELNGMHSAQEGEQADVVVVHTCAVTSNAVRKSRQTVRRLQKEHPGARVVVTGCAAAEDLLERLNGVNQRIGPRENWLEEFRTGVEDLAVKPATEQWDGAPDHLGLKSFEDHSRAFLKIQDGCDIGCTFCIVPRLRRAPRDKPMDLALNEARALAESGHREIVVSGVSVGLYGRDSDGPNLAEVMRGLIEVPGVERIRLSSLHPRELTDELLAVWASSPKMMPHIHLPLQAGSNRILTAMNRSYSAEEFLDAVERARAVLPDPAFNTDVIVGFPGETDEDFAETERVSRAVGFSRMHIFPYSVRPHTRAARLPDRVNGGVAREHCRRLQAVAEELTHAYHARYVGAESRVLTENYDAATGTYRGYTERYIPVCFAGPAGLEGTIQRIRLGEDSADGMTGVMEGAVHLAVGN